MKTQILRRLRRRKEEIGHSESQDDTLNQRCKKTGVSSKKRRLIEFIHQTELTRSKSIMRTSRIKNYLSNI